MKLFYMPFFTADYLASTRDHTAQEHGAHLLLLLTLWVQAGSVPDIKEDLIRLMCIRPRDYNKIRKKVIDRHFQITDGQITNQRLSKELEKASERYRQRSDAGKASGRARQKKAKEISADASTLKEDVPFLASATDDVRPPPNDGLGHPNSEDKLLKSQPSLRTDVPKPLGVCSNTQRNNQKNSQTSGEIVVVNVDDDDEPPIGLGSGSEAENANPMDNRRDGSVVDDLDEIARDGAEESGLAVNDELIVKMTTAAQPISLKGWLPLAVENLISRLRKASPGTWSDRHLVELALYARACAGSKTIYAPEYLEQCALTYIQNFIEKPHNTPALPPPEIPTPIEPSNIPPPIIIPPSLTSLWPEAEE